MSLISDYEGIDIYEKRKEMTYTDKFSSMSICYYHLPIISCIFLIYYIKNTSLPIKNWINFLIFILCSFITLQYLHKSHFLYLIICIFFSNNLKGKINLQLFITFFLVLTSIILLYTVYKTKFEYRYIGNIINRLFGVCLQSMDHSINHWFYNPLLTQSFPSFFNLSGLPKVHLGSEVIYDIYKISDGNLPVPFSAELLVNFSLIGLLLNTLFTYFLLVAGDILLINSNYLIIKSLYVYFSVSYIKINYTSFFSAFNIKILVFGLILIFFSVSSRYIAKKSS